jgi:Skp family chaperone for outer membrane proteins
MTELEQVLNSIANLKTDVDNKIDSLKTDVDNKIDSLKTDVDTKIDAFSKQNDTFNEKFDNYQKATQSIVNLSFGLIASATIITIVQGIFYRK